MWPCRGDNPPGAFTPPASMCVNMNLHVQALSDPERLVMTAFFHLAILKHIANAKGYACKFEEEYQCDLLTMGAGWYSSTCSRLSLGGMAKHGWHCIFVAHGMRSDWHIRGPASPHLASFVRPFFQQQRACNSA